MWGWGGGGGGGGGREEEGGGGGWVGGGGGGDQRCVQMEVSCACGESWEMDENIKKTDETWGGVGDGT